MSEFLDKIKTDPDYRKAFDKGVSAGIVFLGFVELIAFVIWSIVKR